MELRVSESRGGSQKVAHICAITWKAVNDKYKPIINKFKDFTLLYDTTSMSYVMDWGNHYSGLGWLVIEGYGAVPPSPGVAVIQCL